MSIQVQEVLERYTKVNNEVIKDDSLSWQAKGLYTYMVSNRCDWKFSQEEVSRHAKNGLDSTRAAWKELVNAGWIYSERERTEDGKLGGWNHTVLVDRGSFCIERGITIESITGKSNLGESKTGKTIIGKPNLGKTNLGKSNTNNNQAIINTNNNNKQLKERERTDSLFSSLDVFLFFVEQYQKLDMGKDVGGQVAAIKQLDKLSTQELIDARAGISSLVTRKYIDKQRGDFVAQLPTVGKWVRERRWEDASLLATVNNDDADEWDASGF